MLPFEIGSLDQTLSRFAAYYMEKTSEADYRKLHNKVVQSNGLAKLCGLSIAQQRYPTATDFRVITSNLFLLGSMEKITLAAIIALKTWNEQVNKVYEIIPQYHVDSLCRQIIEGSRLSHF